MSYSRIFGLSFLQVSYWILFVIILALITVSTYFKVILTFTKVFYLQYPNGGDTWIGRSLGNIDLILLGKNPSKIGFLLLPFNKYNLLTDLFGWNYKSNSKIHLYQP